jgi:hypothetical protein
MNYNLGLITIDPKLKLLQKYQYKNLEKFSKDLEIKKAQVGHINSRISWMKSQDKANYQYEYNRLRGELEKSILPYQSKQIIEKRLEELKLMAAKSMF